MRGFTPISSKKCYENKKIDNNNNNNDNKNTTTIHNGLQDFFDIPNDKIEDNNDENDNDDYYDDGSQILKHDNCQQHQQEQHQQVQKHNQELTSYQMNSDKNFHGIHNNQDNIPPLKENKHPHNIINPVEKNNLQKKVSNDQKRKKDLIETKQQEKSKKDSFLSLNCVYTKHKSQKRKVWSDGMFKLDTINGYMALYAGEDGAILIDNLLESRNVLPNDAKRVIASYEAGRSEIIEFEKYLVSVEPLTVPVISVPKVTPKPYQIPKFKPPAVNILKQLDDHTNVLEKPKSKTIIKGLYSVDEDDIEDTFYDEYTNKNKNNDNHINKNKSLNINNIWDDDSTVHNPKKMKYDNDNSICKNKTDDDKIWNNKTDDDSIWNNKTDDDNRWNNETDDDNRWNNETDDNNFNCSNDFNFITRNANEDNKKIQDCNQKNNSKNDNNNWDWDF